MSLKKLLSIAFVVCLSLVAAVALAGETAQGSRPTTGIPIMGVLPDGGAAFLKVTDGFIQMAPASSTTTPTHGKIAVAATATAIPASALSGRQTLTLQNFGPNSICCAWANDVTTANAPCIPAASGGIPGSGVFNVSGGKLFYCISSVAQTSPADTRYYEE